MGEVAVLRIVADEFQERGACDLCIDAIAARAGVHRSTVKNALCRAAAYELLVVIERRRPGQKNLPKTVRIINRERKAWIVRLQAEP
jgi:transposase